ncbi:sterol desaturase family protein [Nitrospirillum sp. BR 11752]|uniref:sterol desaturase family protein n=1 Tax=Nitrospirillum sp. BR 11752 TaxID=3104293 RepID=UPI002EAB8BAB|nr:sterol desaturase family protein [Nitrospirillum sp. BR 11752]
MAPVNSQATDMTNSAAPAPGLWHRLMSSQAAGTISLAIGLLSIGAVLCLRYPAWLTTPELRPHYDMDLLRLILALSMGVGVFLGLGACVLNRRRRAGLIGISGVVLALLLGGPYVPYEDFDQARTWVGLDWLVLDLFFTGSAFILLERLLPRVAPDQPVLREGWRLDLSYFTVNHLLIGAFLLTSNHFAHDVFGWAVNGWLQAQVAALPGFVRFLLVILAADAVEYASHRAYHEIPWLWRLHAVHHSPQHMDWLSGSRLHVLEVLITRSLILVPIFLLGFPQDTVFAYLIFVSIQAVLIHSNIAMDLGWLRYVIVTPQFHHWHHASDEEALDRNYCAHTPFWDLVFRTYHQPKDRWPEKYGTVKPIPGGFVQQFLYPFSGPVELLTGKREG